MNEIGVIFQLRTVCEFCTILQHFDTIVSLTILELKKDGDKSVIQCGLLRDTRTIRCVGSPKPSFLQLCQNCPPCVLLGSFELSEGDVQSLENSAGIDDARGASARRTKT